jgi:hypothetical protein
VIKQIPLDLDFEKLTVLQLVKQFQDFMEYEDIVPFTKEPLPISFKTIF